MKKMPLKRPLLLSIVMVVDGWADRALPIINKVAEEVSELVTDYELIIVDNGSDAAADDIYRSITAPSGSPNVQVYKLLRKVDYEVAAWAGVENSLGDLILVTEPFNDTLEPLERALDELLDKQLDLVLMVNEAPRLEGMVVSSLRRVYLALFRSMGGINLQVEASQYRLMSKRVVSYLLQQPRPAARYRALPATAGFARAVMRYTAPRRPYPGASFVADVRRAVRTLLGNSVAPARFASGLSFAGAALNIAYSLYVVILAFTRSDLQPGWTTLSLQQSGMFFLFSVMTFILTEYMVDNVRGSRSGISYFVVGEWNSAVLTRRQRLNVEAPDDLRTFVDSPRAARAETPE